MNESSGPFYNMRDETRNDFNSLSNNNSAQKNSHSKNMSPTVISKTTINKLENVSPVTKLLKKNKHIKECREVMSARLFDTKNLISMDQCKEMI